MNVVVNIDNDYSANLNYIGMCSIIFDYRFVIFKYEVSNEYPI